MSLREKVSVSAHYTRSINIERDHDQVAILEAYVLTSRALRTLERIAEALKSGQHPRAWSLIGPYGSGKSAFGIFARSLLGSPDSAGSKAALKKLQEVNPELAAQFKKEQQKTKGYLPVMLSGSPEPLTQRIVGGMLNAARERFGSSPGRPPKILKELEEKRGKNSIPASEVLSLLDELIEQLEKKTPKGQAGVIFIIDELGKFLEYEAHQYGANDIYILQTLAEYACDDNRSKVLIFALLHQSFEQYAKGLGESLKAEWAKIQGRFEEIPFIESSEQVLRVVSKAIGHNLTAKEEKTLSGQVQFLVGQLAEAKALPKSLKQAEAKQLFKNCYPLHPVTALLLPMLCQKVAQNERTLFSYLASQEEYGFQDSLEKLDGLESWVTPKDIYEYFVANQPAALTDPVAHRRWAEVLTVVDRLNDLDEVDIDVLKTIGLLNIVGAKGGLKASESVLGAVFGKKAAAKAIKSLQDQSAITFRKFSGEFRVWQGSDFDLEEALQQEVAQLGRFSLTEELNRSNDILPVVARAHSIKTGTLRYFEPVFCDADNVKDVLNRASDPRIIFFLAFGQDDFKVLKDGQVKEASDTDIIAVCPNAPRIREAVQEVIALEAVEVSHQEMANDPVAQREYKDRYAAAQASKDAFVQSLVQSPEQNVWYWNHRKRQVKERRALQGLLSQAMDKVYNKAPTLHNELINKEKPSSQAAAGRNKLLFAMLHREGEEDLGIEKFPPEKAIYRSLVRAKGLHAQGKNREWAFEEPEEENDLYSVWGEIRSFLDSTEYQPKALSELADLLVKPPYGLKAGVLPVLFVAALKIYKNEVALYENRKFVPTLTEEILERLSKLPEQFAVQQFRVEGLKKSIYEQYQEALFADGQERSILQLVRPLAQFIQALPEYTQKTKSSDLSIQAKELRSAFNLSKSPQALLFEDIPRVLGFESEKGKSRNIEEMSAALQDVLRELKYAYPNLVESQKRIIAQAFHIDPETTLDDLRKTIAGRYIGLEAYTVDVDGMRAFLKRLTKETENSDEWLSNILMFLGRKPADKWLDIDRAEAEVRLAEFSKRILDLESLRLHEEKVTAKYNSDFDVYLIKSLKKGGEEIDEVVAIDRKKHDAIKDAKKAVLDALVGDKESMGKESQLAVLAEVLDEFLSDYRKKESKSSNKSKPRKAG